MPVPHCLPRRRRRGEAVWGGLRIAGLCIAVTSTWSALAAGGSQDITNLDLNTLMNMDVTVVTAQKRAEDVTTVPISMTVVKTDSVANMNLWDTADLQTVVPGLTTTSSYSNVLPYIRGIGTDITTNGIEPSVAVYVDGVYQADQARAFVDLFDVEQIEVLKGPQGTLYGRNATGGAINITTRGPSDTFHAAVQITGGNLDLRDGSLFVSGPLGERLEVSMAAHLHQRDGDVRNLYDGANVDNQDYYSLHGRAQLEISPTLRAEMLVSYFSRSDSEAFNTQFSSVPAALVIGAPVTTRPYTTYSSLADAAHGFDSSTTALKFNWDPGNLRLQSITSYNEQRFHNNNEEEPSPLEFQEVSASDSSHYLTQEFQVTPATVEGRLNWLAGAFYINGDSAFAPARSHIVLPGIPPLDADLTGEVATRAYAVFGETTWSVTGRFSLTGGLRFNEETKHLENAGAGVAGVPMTWAPDQSHGWDAVTYRAVAKYTLGQTMMYAKTETAFKSGAYNDLNPLQPGPIDPERITAYELGLKTPIADLPLWLDFAAFYNDYRDLQIQVIDIAQGGLTNVVEAPHATTFGLDANLRWRADAHWSFAGGLGLLHATYDDFVTNGVLVPDGTGFNVPASNLQLGGNHLSRSPALTATVSATYTHPTESGAVDATANYYRSSRLYFDPANAYSQGPYGVLGAHVGYRSNDRWSVAVWGRNLANTTYFSAVNTTDMGTSVQYAEPRTYGLTLGYSFGR